MSWDNNNLACILIFPPWQRKGLGALLIGVSYAIAKRENILGGPEKPISDLGLKGYKRYWGKEVARWLLGREVSKGRWKKDQEVTIAECSQDTWIAPDDCLHVLREMGVVEPIEERRKSADGDANTATNGEEEEKIKVKIDKQKVREWCEKNRIGLERVVGEEGFLEGYALPEEEVEDEDEEGEEVEETEDAEMEEEEEL